MANLTETEMMADLQAADAAGDTELAQAIASRIKTSRAKPAIEKTESGARGGLQGLTFGWGDEAAGAVAATMPFLEPAAAGEGKTWGERYQHARDYYRSKNRAAKEENPKTYLAGELAGGVAPIALTAGGAALPRAAGLGAKVLQGAKTGAGVGALYGSGLSEGNAGSVVKDALTSSLLGGATGGLIPVVGAGLRAASDPLRRMASNAASLARARAGAKAAEDIAAPIASARGTLGSETQKGSRYIENLMRLKESMTPEQQALYAQLEAGGVVPTLQQSVAQSTLERLPAQAATIAEKQRILQVLEEAAPEAVKSRAAELLSPAEVKSQLSARAWRYGPPLLGSVVGSVLGGPAGTAVGALAGAGTRPAVQALRRMVKTPAVQNALWSRVEKALAGPSAETTKDLPRLAALIAALRGPNAAPVLAAADEENP